MLIFRQFIIAYTCIKEGVMYAVANASSFHQKREASNKYSISIGYLVYLRLKLLFIFLLAYEIGITCH